MTQIAVRDGLVEKAMRLTEGKYPPEQLAEFAFRGYTRENMPAVSKPETPQIGTIEYLFKDYSGESFKTELLNPVEPVGEEKW